MKIFEKLRKLRNFQKHFLPQLNSLADFDIVRGIGYYQHRGTPLNMKALLREVMGADATVQRRLRRLTRLGVVLKRRARRDRRNLELYVSPRILKIYRRKAQLLRSA